MWKVVLSLSLLVALGTCKDYTCPPGSPTCVCSVTNGDCICGDAKDCTCMNTNGDCYCSNVTSSVCDCQNVNGACIGNKASEINCRNSNGDCCGLEDAKMKGTPTNGDVIRSSTGTCADGTKSGGIDLGTAIVVGSIVGSLVLFVCVTGFVLWVVRRSVRNIGDYPVGYTIQGDAGQGSYIPPSYGDVSTSPGLSGPSNHPHNDMHRRQMDDMHRRQMEQQRIQRENIDRMNENIRRNNQTTQDNIARMNQNIQQQNARMHQNIQQQNMQRQMQMNMPKPYTPPPRPYVPPPPPIRRF